MFCLAYAAFFLLGSDRLVTALLDTVIVNEYSFGEFPMSALTTACANFSYAIFFGVFGFCLGDCPCTFALVWGVIWGVLQIACDLRVLMEGRAGFADGASGTFPTKGLLHGKGQREAEWGHLRSYLMADMVAFFALFLVNMKGLSDGRGEKWKRDTDYERLGGGP